MNRRVLLYIVCTAIITALAQVPRAHAKNGPALRRYALVIGSNTGGGTAREQLRYAGQDATNVADVLRQIGGVSPTDLSLLREPDPPRSTGPSKASRGASATSASAASASS